MDFSLLLEAVSAEVGDIMNLIPDINKIHTDISQIYSDVEAQLIAYSTDITKLTPEQIEQTIKQINRASLQDEKLKQYLGNNGYRTVNVGLSGNSLELLKKEYVEEAMSTISKDIYELVQNASTMDKEEYVRRAVGLQYRFIRIHPFPDSNGRTSRALLNMITIPKGILVDFPKDKKHEYNMCSNETHMEMDAKEYLQAIQESSTELVNMENETELPVYRFVKEYGIIETQKANQGNNFEQTKENSQEMIH